MSDKGKHNRFNSSMSDFIINGTKPANIYLSVVINALYVHGIVPEEMYIGSIVPIPKNKEKNQEKNQ